MCELNGCQWQQIVDGVQHDSSTHYKQVSQKGLVKNAGNFHLEYLEETGCSQAFSDYVTCCWATRIVGDTDDETADVEYTAQFICLMLLRIKNKLNYGNNDVFS